MSQHYLIAIVWQDTDAKYPRAQMKNVVIDLDPVQWLIHAKKGNATMTLQWVAPITRTEYETLRVYNDSNYVQHG